MLHRLRLQPGADLDERRLPRVAPQRRSTHLDELVGFERPVDFSHHGVRQSPAAEMYDRIEAVRARLERFAFARFYFLPRWMPLAR